MSPPTIRSAPEFFDLQRAGLEALLRLSQPEIAPLEAAIEARFREAQADAEGAFRTANAELETWLRRKLDDAAQEHAQRTAGIEAEHASAVATLENQTREALARVDGSLGDIEGDIHSQLDDRLLLADTVAQAGVERLRREAEAVEQQVAEGHRRLGALRDRGQALLTRYGVAVPETPPAPARRRDVAGDGLTLYEREANTAAEWLRAMERMWSPRLFVGARPYVLLLLICGLALAGVTGVSLLPYAPPLHIWGPVALGITALLTLAIGLIVRQTARARLLALYEPLSHAVGIAARALDQHGTRVLERCRHDIARATESVRKNPERLGAERHFASLLAEARRRSTESRAAVVEDDRRRHAAFEQRRQTALAEAQAQQAARSEEVRRAAAERCATATAARDRALAEAQAARDLSRRELAARCQAGLQCLARFLAASAELLSPAEHRALGTGGDADEYSALVPLGHWELNLGALAESVRALAGPAGLETAATTPALLAVPDRAALLLETERSGRQQALDTLRLAMVRLLTALPPGRVRFTIIDPVGLGESFAGFMHLVDYEEALVGGRIWTESEHIEARLAELTSHMENVIQKYLRNEFPTIDAYNRQAGQLAEPYRFLVIADFPANFNEAAARRLGSILSSGARCGVFTLIACDRRLGPPPGLPPEDLSAGSLHLVHDATRFVAQDELLRRFPLTLDAPPPEDVLTRIMHDVGRRAKDALRVEVPFEAIVPPPPQRWTRDAGAGLDIPIGHSGAVRLQHFRLGRGLTQHALVAGKTGSGKSTLLHVIITNLALWYSPEEIELYLVDFKKGVEFKTYVTHGLPHARAIAIESDREFGVSVLQRLDAEMTRRGDLFRAAGVQDLPAYRAATGRRLPRTLLIVDEFQVFFSEDDRLAQEAATLLDRLVRQGRAFGLHILLGSQTLAGTTGLARSTIGQMAVRIALQCSEADSQLILDDTNVAARLLSRPGEAIYNDAGGLVAGNSSFQVAWLPDDQQSRYLEDVRALGAARDVRSPPAIVFEGNAPADIRQNHALARLLEAPHRPAQVAAPHAWLGEPVAIKEPTGVAFARQSGTNLLIVGQRDEAAQTVLAAAVLALAAQHAPAAARFVLLAGAATETRLPGGLADVAAVLPDAVEWIDWRGVPDALAQLAAETQRRISAGANDPAVYVVIYGLQRYRALRRREDSFSFAPADEEAAPATDRQFAEILREGPSVGVHVLAWSDTLATLERTLERQALREFDHRVLFQMSAADSSTLVDTPEANRLGPHRALLFSEERGLLEKFRPYGPADREWLAQVRTALARQTGHPAAG